MSIKEEFWGGMGEGFLKGALVGAAAAAIIGFGITLSLGTGFLPALLAGVLAPITPPGIALCLTAGTAYGIYNGIDDYIDARELQKERKFAKELAEIASKSTPTITLEPAQPLTQPLSRDNKSSTIPNPLPINANDNLWQMRENARSKMSFSKDL